MNPGDNFYYIMNDFVVPITVLRVVDVFHDPHGGTILRYRYLNEPTEIIQGYKKLSESDLLNKEQVNQFANIDEPVGYDLQRDELFGTLSEAIALVRPSRKKNLRRRLKIARRDRQAFIASTWDGKHPGFDPLPKKKIYIRRR